MRTFLVSIGCVALLGVSPVLASDVSRLVLAKYLMQQTHREDVVLSAIPMLTDDMKQVMLQKGSNPSDVENFTNRFRLKFSAELSSYVDQMASAYADAFTEEELSDIIAFYSTSAGRKMVMESPVLTQASLVVMQRLESEIAEETVREIAANNRAPDKKL